MKEPAAYRFADDGQFPNSRLPLLVYRNAVPGGAEVLERLFAVNGWPPRWRATVFTYHHYHSTAHECLGVASGSARLMFGGPAGETVDVEGGDVVVIPAGVAHRRLSSSDDFLVVGAYPNNSADWDLLKGDAGERPRADRSIAAAIAPETDPVQGQGGALTLLWKIVPDR